MYLKVRFISRKPNKDQQFALSEAFKVAFKLKAFPEITEGGLEGAFSESDIEMNTVLDIPTYLCCIGFTAIGCLSTLEGRMVSCASTDTSQDLGDSSWGRFSETYREYGV